MVAISSLLAIAFTAVAVNAAPSLEARQNDGQVRANTNIWQSGNCQFPPAPVSIDRTFFLPGHTSGGNTREVGTCYNETYGSVDAQFFHRGPPAPTNCRFNAYTVTGCVGNPSKTFDDLTPSEIPTNPHCHRPGAVGQLGLSYMVVCPGQ